MELVINNFMKRDLFGWKYYVVYVESPNEWWILRHSDSRKEIERMLKEESREGGTGEYWIIDGTGRKI